MSNSEWIPVNLPWYTHIDYPQTSNEMFMKHMKLAKEKFIKLPKYIDEEETEYNSFRDENDPFLKKQMKNCLI